MWVSYFYNDFLIIEQSVGGWKGGLFRIATQSEKEKTTNKS